MAPSQPSRTKIFISYSHKDRKYLEQLRPHLNQYGRAESIETWEDGKIQPGELWFDTITQAIATAKVAILLVSAEFFASKFIAEHELPPLLSAAETNSVKIIPVIVRTCDFENTDLAKFQAVNKPSRALAKIRPSDRDEIWVKVAKAAKQALENHSLDEHDLLDQSDDAHEATNTYALDTGMNHSGLARLETISERIQAFRTERLAKIVAGETPVKLPKGAKIVLHLVPYRSFEPGISFPVSTPEQRNSVFASLHPIGAPTLYMRLNFDGIVKYDEDSYVQFFRNGCVEAVDTELLRQYSGRPIIPWSNTRGNTNYEHYIIVALRAYLPFLEQVGVEPPIAAMLSLLDVAGYVMGVNPRSPFQPNEHPIDRNNLLMPEAVIGSYNRVAADILKPSFDAIWNATGKERSLSYDEEGNWLSPYGQNNTQN